MRLKIIMAMVAVCIAATSYCQPGRYKIMYSHSQFSEWAKAIQFNADSSIWVNTGYALNAGGYGILMLKIDNAGNVIEHKQCEKPNFSYLGIWSGSLLKIDSNYYVGCEVQIPDPTPASPGDMRAFPGLVKYTLLGDTVWTKHLELDTSLLFSINSCRKTNDNCILICGSKSTSVPAVDDFLLMKLDTAGNLLWEKTYGLINRDERAISVEELPDSTIVLSGFKQYSGSVPFAKYHPWIFLLDRDGNIKLSKQYYMPSMNYGGVIVKPAIAGKGYWMVGISDSLQNSTDYLPYSFLAYTDSNFNILMRKFFNDRRFIQIWDFEELPNGDVVFCGDKEDSAAGSQFGYLAKIDKFGNLLWWRTYHEYVGNDNYLSSVRQAPDGGFVACGSTFSPPPGSSQNAWIIKTDSLGCIVLNCALDIDNLEELEKSVKVYPNPAKDLVTIETLHNAAWELSIIDISGRVMHTAHFKERKTIVNLEEFPSGMYIYRLKSTYGVQEGKFFKK